MFLFIAEYLNIHVKSTPAAFILHWYNCTKLKNIMNEINIGCIFFIHKYIMHNHYYSRHIVQFLAEG
uniref:Uncharacterized protein n=1 Tax=Rodentolepis nana TaxID=102285 RepID=A0A0R3TMR8_RODNA